MYTREKLGRPQDQNHRTNHVSSLINNCELTLTFLSHWLGNLCHGFLLLLVFWSLTGKNWSASSEKLWNSLGAVERGLASLRPHKDSPKLPFLLGTLGRRLHLGTPQHFPHHLHVLIAARLNIVVEFQQASSCMNPCNSWVIQAHRMHDQYQKTNPELELNMLFRRTSTKKLHRFSFTSAVLLMNEHGKSKLGFTEHW